MGLYNASTGYIELRQLAAELAPGETRSGQRCTFCGGGQSGEHSLSISRTSAAEALYYCHRASCGRAGRVACWGFRLAQQEGSTTPASGRQPTTSVYTGTVDKLDQRWNAYLLSKYGLSEGETTRAGWGQDARTNLLVVPVYDRRSVRIGTETRKSPFSDVGMGPKTRSYPSGLGTWQGWCRPLAKTENSIVVVEDVISALKVSRQFTAVAIFGTNLNHKRIFDILEDSTKVCIALDADATEKAFHYARKFSIYGQFTVALLDRDLKYEDDNRIKQIVEESV